MKVTNLCRGGWGSACYYVTDDAEEHAVLIDPSAPPAALPHLTGRNAPQPEALLLTHAHYDHMIALDAWREQGIPLFITAADAPGLADASLNVSEMIVGRAITFAPADRLLYEGDVISLGNESLTVILTPGHTSGSCCYFGDGILFSGDTVFSDGSFGRCDLPGGSFTAIGESLKRILALPPETRIFPGHGAPTTVGTERYYHGIV